MDQSLTQMLKLIEEDGFTLAKKAEMCKQTRPDLISKVEEFNSFHQSLSKCYEHLAAELSKSIPSEFYVQDADHSESGYSLDSPLLTPGQKLSFHKAAKRVPSVSSNGASPDLLSKEETESFSSFDSESESFNSSGNAYYSFPVNTDCSGLQKKIIEMGAELPRMEKKLLMAEEENGDSVLNEEENKNFEELHGRMIGYVEELRLSKLKLQLSEDEVERLKGELEKSIVFRELSGTWQARLESALRGIQTREADLEVERRKVSELQKQITEAADESKYQLKLADEVSMLNAKLNAESKVLDLQERIKFYENELSNHDRDAKALKDALHNAQEKFSVEKAHLQSEISTLSDKQTMLEVKLREWELQGKSMEDKLRQCETEKMEMRNLYDVQKIGLQGEINQLKLELMDRDGQVEVQNKKLDSLKFEYDMLVAEKDGISAKINTLIAEVNSQDNQIRQLEGQLQRLHSEHMELIAGSESSKKLVDELRMKLLGLEKVVNRQRVELLAGAEEKREAIRQLCFSLEHYRSGYKELLGHKRHEVMA